MHLLLLTCVTLLPSSSAMTVADSERPSGVKIWVIPALVPQMPMPTSAAGMAGWLCLSESEKKALQVLMLHIWQHHEQCMPHAASSAGI